jgi:hypothetical protein
MPITTKGALNFWNNIASFCSVRLVYISSATANPTLMYKSDNVSYPDVPVSDDGELITAEQVKRMLSNVEDTINKVTKTTSVKYTMILNSCSCSSSSSSSCSSSSSSSSSMFIAYMKI